MGWLAQAHGLPALEPGAAQWLRRLPVAEVEAGAILFRPGEASKGFVIVLSGRIDVFLTGASGREILLYAVAPGQSCVQSTLGLLGGEPYSAEAIAREDTRLVLVPQDIFAHLMDDSPAFRRFVFAAFAERMQSMMHLLERVAFQRVEARLARCLLERAQEATLRATHAEIATMIGTAREVVSRRLDALERRGVLRLDRGAVHILDIRALAALAEDG
ncbi:MAG: Crp/Fnr family transcriptional regulator [Roseovarius sp.]